MDRSAKCVICGNDVPKKKWVPKEVKCPVCGKSFMQRTKNHEYCSKDCHNQVLKEKKRLEKLTYKKGTHLEKRRCHTCGKPTDNYWCSSCWRERAIQYGIPFRDVPGFWHEYHNGTK